MLDILMHVKVPSQGCLDAAGGFNMRVISRQFAYRPIVSKLYVEEQNM